MPSLAWIRVAVEGKVSSGVLVAQTIRSISSGSRPARPSACLAALKPSSEVNSPSAAMCRSPIPVRCLIHASEVSTILDNSAFVTTRSGRYEPIPVT